VPDASANDPFVPATYATFHDSPSSEDGDGARTWYVCGQAMLVAYSDADPGASLVRESQPDEYALVLPDADTSAVVEYGGQTSTIAGFSLTFVGPGASSVRLPDGGRVVRIFTTAASDLVARCPQAPPENPRIAPLRRWPEPAGGYGIRSYPLGVEPGEGCFGRIFRSSTLMLNFIQPSDGPRDPTALSPHHHDDFEQGSLALDGEFVHHLRWPWTQNRHQWRDDEHVRCGSPSIAIIPPPAIHTTEAIGAGANVLVDVFCPPRLDFAQRPGWVLNDADYPVPGAAGVA
jgi:hypothetical protein